MGHFSVGLGMAHLGVSLLSQQSSHLVRLLLQESPYFSAKSFLVYFKIDIDSHYSVMFSLKIE